MQHVIYVLSAIGFLSIISGFIFGIIYAVKFLNDFDTVKRSLAAARTDIKTLHEKVREHERWIKNLENGAKDMLQKEKP